jgi:hypothetical protein
VRLTGTDTDRLKEEKARGHNDRSGVCLHAYAARYRVRFYRLRQRLGLDLASADRLGRLGR